MRGTVLIAMVFSISFMALLGCSDKNSTEPTLPKPIANFSFERLDQFSPCRVQFANASENAESYLWKFGDSDSSTAKNPVHTYLQKGQYTVRLTAYRGNENAAKTDSIDVPGTPQYAKVTSVEFTGSSYPGGFNESFSLSIYDMTDRHEDFKYDQSGADFVSGFPFKIESNMSNNLPFVLALDHKYRIGLSIRGYNQGYQEFQPSAWEDYPSTQGLSIVGTTFNSFNLHLTWHE